MSCVVGFDEASDAVTRHRLTLRSHISTAIKHRVNIMTALRQAITGDPWKPSSIDAVATA